MIHASLTLSCDSLAMWEVETGDFPTADVIKKSHKITPVALGETYNPLILA